MHILILLLIIYFNFLLNVITCKDKNVFYRCGVNGKEKKPIVDKNPILLDKNDELFRRRLQNTDANGYKNFNIYLDLVNLENDIKIYKLTKYHDLIIDSLKKAVQTLESLLKIKQSNEIYTFSDESIIEANNIELWNKTILGDESKYNIKELDIDLIIFGQITDLGENILAAANPTRSTRNFRPIMGIMYININNTYVIKNSQEFLETTFLHELTHILGFSYYYFNDIFHFVFSEIDKYGINRTYLNSPKVIEIAKKYYNCNDINGVELENYGVSGTAFTHWEARILLGEYMNGFIYTPEQVVSEFTLAFLEDTGFYKVNYYTGGLMRYGKNKGCEFVKNKCVNSSFQINPYFENEFFDKIYNDNVDQSCTSGRQSRVYYAFWLRNKKDFPDNPNYFNKTDYGGYPSADFCPVAEIPSTESMLNYYIGHCSERGSGEYGIFAKSNYNKYNTSKEMESLTGETYSDQSFCFLSSLIKNENKKSNNYIKMVRPVCYEMFCSSKSLTIKVNDDYIVCPRSGGKISVEGYKGYFLCPDFNLMCSGTVICNNIFDCIEKKSEIKEESYIYDYEIKTSQNIFRAEEEDSITETNYELSDDGMCPLNCTHCKKNKRCIKCKNGYKLLGHNNETKITCVSKKELETSYYLKNSIYYKCIDYCNKCSNGTNCEQCENNYKYLNEKCIKEISNCKEYNSNGTCKKCNENFVFKENDRNNCVNISKLEGYYTKDGGISYYQCDGKGENHIENCKKCNYNNYTSILECIECNSDYIILEKETNKCYSKTTINNNYFGYFYINSTHMKACSEAIKNCYQCENDQKCTKCNTGYYLKNNEINKCYNKNDIKPIDAFYLDKNNTTYYSCNNSDYNSIKNCKKCESKDSCSLCDDNFAFINKNKTKCYDITKLKNKYYKDPDDSSNYNSCSSIDTNCLTCSSFNVCNSCNKGFDLYKDRNKCVNITSNKYYKNSTDNLYYPCNESIGCVECSSKEICIKCEENKFALINNICKTTSELDNSYFLDKNSSTYKLCKEVISNCESCNSGNDCIKCISGYTKIDKNNDACYLISELGNNYYQDPSDNYNYIKCSNLIKNCLLCNSSQCLLCDNEYIFINDDFNQCILKSSIEINKYFTNNNNTYYSCEDEKYKNNEKCQKINDDLTTSINEQTIVINNNTSSSSEALNTSETLTAYLLQVQVNNNNLLLYVFADFYIPKNYYFSTSVSIYIAKSLRNLQQVEKREVKISRFTEYINQYDKDIVGLTADDSFREIIENYSKEGKVRIVVDNISIDGNEKTNFILMNTDSSQTQTFNFNNIIGKDSNYKIKLYKAKSVSEGCDFNVTVDNEITENKKEIILQFEEYNTKNEIINATCLISSNYKRQIPCSLEENTNKTYKIKDYLYYDNNELFAIEMENKDSSFSLKCMDNSTIQRIIPYSNSKSSSSALSIKIIVFIIFVVWLL